MMRILVVCRASVIISSIAAIFMSWTGVANAAVFFVPERETAYGAWKSILYRTLNGNRYFCSLESESNGIIFRINRYKDNNDTFLELFNPDWTMMEGVVRFSLQFKGEDVVGMELKGKSWGDSYTYDVLDNKYYLVLLGLLAKSSLLTIMNSNDAELVRYDLGGAADAVADYNRCVDAGG